MSTVSKIERYDSLSRGGHDVVKINLCPSGTFIWWTRTLKLRSLWHNTWFRRVNKSSMHNRRVGTEETRNLSFVSLRLRFMMASLFVA